MSDKKHKHTQKLLTNQEILEKAISRAIDGGWLPEWTTRPLAKQYERKSLVAVELAEAEEKPYQLIFNHDFAKSLWPTQASGSVDPRAVSPSTARPLIPTWQARLMEMVVSDDPIAYLGENI